MQRIIHNKARCRKCNQIIESCNIHDFVPCKCGAIFVDGGHEYLRRGGKLEDIEELNEIQDMTKVLDNVPKEKQV